MVKDVQDWCKGSFKKAQTAFETHEEKREQKKIQALKDEDPLLSGNSSQNNTSNSGMFNIKDALKGHIGGSNWKSGFKNPRVRQKWMKRGSVAALIIIGVGIGGGAGLHAYIHHLTNADEQTASRKHRHVTFVAKTVPNATIFTNGVKAGQANKKGLYQFSDLPIHTKVYAKYGKNNSSVYLLKPSDNNSTLKIKFIFPSKKASQKFISRMYDCFTNLINHNDPVSGNYSFDSFFSAGSGEKVYRALYSWAKVQNRRIDETPKPVIKTIRRRIGRGKKSRIKKFKIRERPAFTQIGALQGIHFVKHIQSVSLAKDGSIIIRYRVETIYNRSRQDHVSVYNWIASCKKVNGHWQITDAKSAAKPLKSYNP